MPPKPKRITTAADKLYDLVKDKHEISFKDAAQELKVPIQTIEAWATFLEEDELLSIKYKLTTPYLILPTFDKKKAKGKEIKPLFQEKIADMEIKKEMDGALELLDTADESRSRGEFVALDRISGDLLGKLQKVVDFLTSRMELSPQSKTSIMDEIAAIKKSIGSATELLKNNKFDEANTTYSELHTRMRKLLEKTKGQYSEVQEESTADETTMDKLLEKTYGMLEKGELEAGESNYTKLKRMFILFSRKSLSEKSDMQNNILKLNRDLAVYSNKINNQRMKAGSKEINKLLKLANQDLNKNQFASATTRYLQIKKLFEQLPQGFLKTKRQLKEDVLKIFEKIAKEREKRLRSRFNINSKQIEELLKELHKSLDEGRLQPAFETYKNIGRLYSELPHGFMKEKFIIQNKLISVYNVLSQHLESTTEKQMNSKVEKLLSLLADMKTQIEHDDLGAANNTYQNINVVFKEFPAGFIKKKTALQERIIEQYSKLLSKQDNTRTVLFKNSIEDLEKMIVQAYNITQKGDYDAANALYRKIKAAYVKMQPADLRQREMIRNKILTLYRRILMKPNQAAEIFPLAGDNVGIHKKIKELKLRSKAHVKMPL